MSIIQRYLARHILTAFGFVLLAFIALFAFFDLINELGDVGKNGYSVRYAMLMVLFGLPARIYELLPIAALIGTIYALAQLAAHSEFTIFRVSGLSTLRAAMYVLAPGLILVAVTFFMGEVVTPRVAALSQELQARLSGGTVASAFRSGLWVKDRASNERGEVSTRFVNIGQIATDNSLERIKIYEFDAELRLKSIRFADKAEFVAPAAWRLQGVVETRFNQPAAGSTTPISSVVEKQAEQLWPSELTPGILQVLQVNPDRMGARNLGNYIRHLEENRQKTERYEIAFWKKMIYPFAVLVMMALALPFAYMQARSGGVSLKIFTGIMLGIGFYLLNNLFSHLGLLNTWPPFISAALPSIVVLALAMMGLRWVERH